MEWNGMDTPPRMQQGHMAIKTQEHEDFKDTRTREHKGTWAHGHMGHSQTTQRHKDTRAQEHTDNHKHKHKHKHNNERGRGGSILRGGWRSEVPLQVEERAVEQRWRGGVSI